MARPTKYQPELHDDWAWALAVDGKTDREIAREFGISKATLNTWKLEHPTFLDSLKSGKETADASVTRCLFQRATGYKMTRTKTKQVRDSKGKKTVTTESESFEVPPNVTAQIYWLKNRNPAKWKNRNREEIPEMEILPATVDMNDIIQQIEADGNDPEEPPS